MAFFLFFFFTFVTKCVMFHNAYVLLWDFLFLVLLLDFVEFLICWQSWVLGIAYFDQNLFISRKGTAFTMLLITWKIGMYYIEMW